MVLDQILIGVVFLGLYIVYAASGLYPGDAGDMVTAAATFGIPHPPGYPLYTALGWLITRIPVSTEAWRMSVMSSLFHSVALILIYRMAFRVTRSRAASWFSVLLLGGNYLFFQYSITPEVFSLLSLFVAFLTYLAIRLHDRFSTRIFFLFCLGLGLSFAHHPLIVLIVPPVLWYLYPALRKHVIGNVRMAIMAGCSFAAGVLPYIYIIAAAHGRSVLVWDRPVTLERFIRLLTRADYGQFRSGIHIGNAPSERLLNVQALWNFLVDDLTFAGLVLVCIGFYRLFRKNIRLGVFFACSVILFGPVFSFYASFPMVNSFGLAVFERFMLPMYIFLSVTAGIGALAAAGYIAGFIGRSIGNAASAGRLTRAVMAVLFLLPVTFGAMNLWRFYGLSGDMTTEYFVQDLLDSAPPQAVLLLNRDTPIFGAQYVRYVQNYRSDTDIIHLSRLATDDYRESLRRAYDPSLRIPEATTSGFAYMHDFMRANDPFRPVVSNDPLAVPPGWVWQIRGLLYELVPDGFEEDADTIILRNQKLWEGFHNPEQGILSRYKHLYLTAARDEYALAAKNFGMYLLDHTRYEDAAFMFQKAISYQSDIQTAKSFTQLGRTYALQGKCDEALEAFASSRQDEEFPDQEYLYYQALTWRDCVGDEASAERFFERLRDLEKLREIPLEQQ